MTFTPCSPRHRHCSPAHAALVRSYREERERLETLHEQTLTARGELEHAKATGFQLVDFADWLKAHKHTH